MRYYTTAPASYDGFGTRRTHTLYRAASDRRRFYIVEIAAEALAWQIARYQSGGYAVYDQEGWRTALDYGHARFAEDSAP